MVGPGWAGGLERMEAAMYDKEKKMRGREDMVYTYYRRRCRIYKVKHVQGGYSRPDCTSIILIFEQNHLVEKCHTQY